MAPTQTPTLSVAHVDALAALLTTWGVDPRDHMTDDARACMHDRKMDAHYGTPTNSPLHHDNRCRMH